MTKLYNGLPVYEAKINDENDGIYAISLVDYPAVESNFVCFKSQDKIQKFSIENEEERLITGVVMVADQPIYRIGNSGFEYYITFNKETIKQMAAKMLADGTFKRNDLQHDGQMIGGLELVELYIKDEAKGINPNFVSVPDGSLMATYHVTDDGMWEEVKNGNYLNGFSLEGYFDILESETYNKQIKNNKMKLMEKLFKSLVKFSEIKTDKGILLIQDGEEIAVGTDVYVEVEGEWIEAEAGEYALEDGKVIVVADGKIAEIKDPEAIEEPAVEEPVAEVEIEAAEEEAPAEEVIVEPAPEERDDKQEQIDALKAEIAELKADIEGLRTALAEIVQQPVVEPIVEEFSKVKDQDSPSKLMGKQAKAAKLFSSIKK